MKKIIYRVLIFIILIFFSSIIYLSTIGVKTDRFNEQVSFEIKKINDQLELDLEKINIILDPFKLQLSLKTIGASLRNKDKIIRLESIKSNIDIKTFLNNEFSLTELDISTRSLDIKNLISFIRLIEDNAQLFIVEKFIKKGYLIADINLKFDDKGNIKNDFLIKGLIKNSEIKTLKNFNFSKINFHFNIKDNDYDFKNINLSLNNNNISFPELNVKKENKKFLFTGKNINKNISLNQNQITQFIDYDLDNIKIINIEFDSDNIFSFSIDKKYNLENFKISSDFNIKEMNLSNKYDLKTYFPEVKDNLNLKNHKLKIEFKKNHLSLKGNGQIFVQKESDDIEYKITKSKDIIKFSTFIDIKKNPFYLDFLNFQKNKNSNLSISFNGNKNLSSKELFIKNIDIKEKDNHLEVKNLILSKNYKIKKIDQIDLNYSDKDSIKNKISIMRKNKDYNLNSSSFNATKLLDDLLKTDKKLKLKKIFDNNFKINIKIDKIFLDKDNITNNLDGYLVFKNSEIEEGDLSSSSSNNKKIKLTIRSRANEKITTLYSDLAKPFVDRYKFIKGFEEGNLDFYLVKKNDLSNSKVVIDNFKVQEVPALAKLLTLASLQGIADLLTGEGIRFSDFEMTFSNKDDLMKIEELYAIGPAISILMDGYIEGNKLISLRGTLVPATTINRTISSIPLIGDILVGKKVGEGVFGVSFKIKGPPKKLKTTVNPVKTLTPRFITRTIEKIKKN